MYPKEEKITRTRKPTVTPAYTSDKSTLSENVLSFFIFREKTVVAKTEIDINSKSRD